MSRKRVPGVLSLTAMRALSSLRRAHAVDAIEARPCRPTDRVDFLLEARRLIAAGASVTDVAYALDVTTAVVGTLIGPVNERYRGAWTDDKRRESPRNRVESVVIEAVAGETENDNEQQDHA